MKLISVIAGLVFVSACGPPVESPDSHDSATAVAKTSTPDGTAADSAEAAGVRGPLPRMYSHLVGTDAGVVLIGGFTFARPPAQIIVDMWAFGEDGWSEITPELVPPPPVPAGAYDSRSALVVMDPVAGCEIPGYADSPLIDQESCDASTWVYDPAANAWEERITNVKPRGLLGTAMAYDAESNRTILFSGLDLAVFPAERLAEETWAYDAQTNTWTQMSPEVSPSGRNFHLMEYDAQSDRVVMFGGGFGDESVWAYDYNSDSWTQLPPADPAPLVDRFYSRMVYEPVADRLVVYGGAEDLNRERPLSDTWTYDYDSNTWTELFADSPPGARGWHAMAYHPTRESIVMFGGGQDRTSPMSDTWLYDYDRNSWSVIPERP